VRIVDFEVFECDLGWRTISFLKLSTDGGFSGWSEFNESFGNAGLGSVVRSLRDFVVGSDPDTINRVVDRISMHRLPAAGGINRQATAAIENALFDLKARIHNVSVRDLFGGGVRDRIPLYWSHCGSYRLGEATADLVGHPIIRSYDDVEALGREVRERGFNSLKTNVIAFDDAEILSREAGWARLPGAPGRGWDNRLIDSTVKTLEAFRRGAGDDASIHLDVNFGYYADGYRRLAKELASFDLAWLELDGLDPRTLASVRAVSAAPIASGESVFGAAAYVPYFEERSMDVAIVDVVWNGIAESIRIANLAAAFSVSVAPHNFYGPLASVMSAHFSSIVSNFSVMEIDVDAVSWRDEFLVDAPTIDHGELVVPEGPGWGVTVDESVVRARSVRS
jgi:L-alanine-DL-glutamate epimerase-like enolase superfamily enzyme